MKKTQNGFIVPLLLAVIAFLLAGGVAYLYTQKKSENPPVAGNVALPQATSTALIKNQPQPQSQTDATIPITENWKTYTNTKYGYSFKYPDTLKLVQGTTNGINGVTLNKSGTLEFNTLYPSFQVVIDSGSSFGTSQSDVKIDGYLFYKTIIQRDPKDLPSDVTICGKSGYKGFTVNRILVLTKGFSNLTINGIVCQNDESLLSTFEKILSTFHYTGNGEVPNGKIYKNDTFGYLVEIPQPWLVDQSKADAVTASQQGRYTGVISVIPNKTSETLDSLRKQTPSLNEDVLIDGQSAIRGILDFEAAGSYYVVKIIYQNKIYTLDRGIAAPEIFSTFKFTETTPVGQTSDLKTYTNTKYGFSFSLLASWVGYSIITNTWSGYSNGPNGDMTVTTGPMVSIRHPLWTSQNPRQDIPIMIFTMQQWNDLQQGKFNMGAAPIGPSELGRNANYVFALPARYNYASPIGWEEVAQILNSNPLHTF